MKNIVCVVALALLITGCNNHTPNAKPASADQANKYMATLEPMPAQERMPYLRQHPEVERSISATKDKALIGKFGSMMSR